tara:strand:- start:1483 stop:1911 length:429 start_codon:yes stop_codon:yes gene_type:complete
MNLGELVTDLYSNLIFLIKKIAKQNNLSTSQFFCIYAIPSQGISQSDLAKILCLDISTLSRNLDKLIIKQIVKKQASALDKRKQKVFLTELGNEIYFSSLNDLNKSISILYNHPHELEDIDSMLNAISQLNWLLLKNRYDDE